MYIVWDIGGDTKKIGTDFYLESMTEKVKTFDRSTIARKRDDVERVRSASKKAAPEGETSKVLLAVTISMGLGAAAAVARVRPAH